jgi:hypothetical protein
VIAACPDREWRAIIALCRFAGLRAPSELVGLMWTDVDWKRRALTVRSPKTEHHEGQAQRLVPISDRLREILNDLWTSAGPSESKMLPSIASSTKNLRTRFQKILKRAKVSPWPRLFQNLRASAETDWVERFPQHEVASWLGHSPTVARTHYLQTRDMHFAAAAGLNTDGSSLEGSSDSASGATHGQRIADCIAPASQNASQQGAAPKSVRSRAVPQMQTARELAPVVADGRESSRAVLVTPEGFAHSAAAIAAAECPQSRWADATDEGGRARRGAKRSGDHDQPRSEQTPWTAWGGPRRAKCRPVPPPHAGHCHFTHNGRGRSRGRCA